MNLIKRIERDDMTTARLTATDESHKENWKLYFNASSRTLLILESHKENWKFKNASISSFLSSIWNLIKRIESIIPDIAPLAPIHGIIGIS